MPDDASLAVLPPTFPNAVQSDNTTADAYAPPALPKGLCYDAEGQVRIRPEIEAKLDEHRWQLAYQLIIQGRNSEANSYIGCHLIHKVVKRCTHWHEAHVAAIRCGKLFLCDDCAAASSRVSRFHYEHAELYEHLIKTQFSVLTFSIATPHTDFEWMDLRTGLNRAQDLFKSFIELYSSDAHGWYFLAAFNDDEEESELEDRVKFFAIHAGDKLPAWKTMDAQWKHLAGTHATFRSKLFDGRDGDDQSKGLKLAFSGFDAYYAAVGDIGGWAEVAVSEAFDRYSTGMPYGTFRAFAAKVEGESANDEMVEPTLELAPDNCLTCQEPLIRDSQPVLMTIDEIISKGARIFSHITKPTYRRNSRPESCTCIGHEHGDG